MPSSGICVSVVFFAFLYVAECINLADLSGQGAGLAVFSVVRANTLRM